MLTENMSAFPKRALCNSRYVKHNVDESGVFTPRFHDARKNGLEPC